MRYHPEKFKFSWYNTATKEVVVNGAWTPPAPGDPPLPSPWKMGTATRSDGSTLRYYVRSPGSPECWERPLAVVLHQLEWEEGGKPSVAAPSAPDESIGDNVSAPLRRRSKRP